MPTYEYHCPSCNATYDLRESYSAETTHLCRQCAKGTAKRVLHAPPIVFKGSGWYVTDSRGKSSSAVTDSHDHHHSESDSHSSSSEKSESSSSSSASTASGEGSTAAAS